MMESSQWNCSDMGRMATLMAARSMEQMNDTAGGGGGGCGGVEKVGWGGWLHGQGA